MPVTAHLSEANERPLEGLLEHALDAVVVLVDVAVALGFTVDEHQSLDRIVVGRPHGADARAVALADLLARL